MRIWYNYIQYSTMCNEWSGPDQFAVCNIYRNHVI